MTKKAIKEAKNQELIEYLIKTAFFERVPKKWEQDAAAICAELAKRGTTVDEVQLTESEYRRLTSTPRRGFALFRTYISALYYTQD